MNNKLNLKQEYYKSWKYLKESKKFIWIIASLFGFFTLIGFFIPAPIEIQEQIFKFIEELLAQTQGMSRLELIRFIFLNNLQSSFISMICGIVLGIFPIIMSIANGYLLGFVGALSSNAEGPLSLWKVLPHGIFELPAIFISLSMGLKIGTFFFQKNKKNFLKDSLINSIRIFLIIVIPLLIIAAIIEGTLISLIG